MPRPSGLARLCALILLAFALVATSCASVESGSTQVSGGDDDDADAGPPQYGGKLVYGLEAETTNGWCLPEGQLDGNTLTRVDFDAPAELDLRMPSGNEAGANDKWIPGGRLPDGAAEAVIDVAGIPPARYSATPVDP